MKKLLALFLIVFFSLNALADITITRFIITDTNAAATSSQTPVLILDVNEAATHLKFSCSTDFAGASAIETATTNLTITNQTFNITTGNGCNTGDGSKTIYAKVYQAPAGFSGDFETAPDVNRALAVSDTIILDTTPPTITINLPQAGTTELRIVLFDTNDALSGISQGTIRVDVNASASTSFSSSSNCTAFDKNYSCTYTENRFDLNNTDYNVTVFAADIAGNTAQATRTFHYVDTNAPAQVTGVTATSGSTQAVISWSAVTTNANASPMHDLASYLVYMGTASGFDTNASNLIATIAAGTTTYTKTGLTNGTAYYFKVSAKDKSGLEGTDSEEKSATPSENSAGIAVPTISSSTHSSDAWSTNNDPQFSWSTVSGATVYKCAFDQSAATNPSTDCSGTSYNQDGTQEGTWYFHLKACNASASCSSTAHFKVKIDRQGPAQPSITVTANTDGTMRITWSAISDNPSGENSGLKEYQVYRHFDDDFETIDSRRIGITTETSFTDDEENLVKGTRYNYKVRALDNLGNPGNISAEKSAIFLGVIQCENSFSFNVEDTIGGESFEAKATSTSAMTNPVLKLEVDGTEIEAQSTDTTSTTITAVFLLDENLHEKTGKITLTSKDTQGNDCTEEKSFTVDRQGPETSFIEPLDGNYFFTDKPIRISALDSTSSVKEVKVFYRQNQQEFVFLADAQSASENAQEFEIAEGLEAIVPGQVELKIRTLDFAGNTSEETITVTARSGSNVFGQQSYSFEGNMTQKLKEALVNEDFVQKISQNHENARPSRTLEIIKDGDSFRARITLSFTNTQDKKSFRVIEIMPKNFAQNASEITSSTPFNVLKDDPVLEFIFNDVEKDQTIVFSYELKSTLTETQATSMLEQQTLNSFDLPPIMLDESEDSKKLFENAQDNPLFGFLAFGIIAMVILILVLVVGGGAVIAYIYKKTTATQMEKSYMQAKGNLMQRASAKLRNWLEKNQEQPQKKKKFEQ